VTNARELAPLAIIVVLVLWMIVEHRWFSN